MPEGDTVRRTADRLGQALTGHRLTLVDIRWGTLGEEPLRDARVEEILPRGKHLLHRVDTGWTLHTHLRMEGSWRIERAGSAAAARGMHRPDLRVGLGSTHWTTLGLRLGAVDLVRREDEHRLVGHLGPDVLGPDWDPTAVVERLRGSPGTAVAAALLDQRHLAGVGTFWASEALFLDGIHPWQPVGDLPPDQLRALVRRVHDLMVRGVEHAVQSSTGDRAPQRRSFVHGRSGRPCRRCGSTIRVAPLGEAPSDRVFFSCPGCQGGVAPTDDGRPQAPMGHRR